MGMTGESKNGKGRLTYAMPVRNNSFKKEKSNTKYIHVQIPEYLQTSKGKPEASKTSTIRTLTIIYNSQDEIEEDKVVGKEENRMEKDVKWIKKNVLCMG